MDFFVKEGLNGKEVDEDRTYGDFAFVGIELNSVEEHGMGIDEGFVAVAFPVSADENFTWVVLHFLYIIIYYVFIYIVVY